MESILKLIERYGVNALLVAAIFWMNNRIVVLEENLIDCYEARIVESLRASKDTTITQAPKHYAVLVRKPKVKKRRA